MTIEEKAQAYDKALEKAGWLEIVDCPKNEALEEIFPQLKDEAKPDFDDEGIRRAIISHFWNCYKRYGGITFCDYTISQVISWLEKQGEQKPTYLPKSEDYGIDGMHVAIDILTKTLGKVDGYQTDDGILEHEAAIATVKKLREQKPTEWSEKDEKIYNKIYNLIHEAAYANYDVDEDGKELGEYARITNWLKSLKPKNAWKPSRFQMAALYDIKRYAEEGDVKRTLLQSLYNDLKNLQK